MVVPFFKDPPTVPSLWHQTVDNVLRLAPEAEHPRSRER
jgi:hypothetical protein